MKKSTSSPVKQTDKNNNINESRNSWKAEFLRLSAFMMPQSGTKMHTHHCITLRHRSWLAVLLTSTWVPSPSPSTNITGFRRYYRRLKLINFMIVDWGRGPTGRISLQNSGFLMFVGQKYMDRFTWNLSRRKYYYKHKCKSWRTSTSTSPSTQTASPKSKSKH